MESIPKEIKIKIIEKLLGYEVMRIDNPKVTIPEFKFIITSVKIKGNFRIKKAQWFRIAKDLERENIIRLHGTTPIEIIYKKPLIEKIKDSMTF